MTQKQAPPFAAQRILFFAMVLGMTVYMVVAGVVVQQNDGKGLAEPPVDELDTVALVVGGVMLLAALTMRTVLGRKAAQGEGHVRGVLRFASHLVPIAMLEAGCLLGVTAWMLNGRTVPSLAVALVLLAAAIAMVPFSDPDEGDAR